jgi:hypothetical protein
VLPVEAEPEVQGAMPGFRVALAAAGLLAAAAAHLDEVASE